MLTLKKATINEIQLLFDWVNDTDVRNNSINTTPVKWEEHLRWFNKKIADTNCIIYIGYFNDEPMGQVRFDKEGEVYFIDYSITKEYRGRGLAKQMLATAIRELNNLKPGKKTIRGAIKISNLASEKVFKSLGFTKTTTLDDATNELKVFSRIES